MKGRCGVTIFVVLLSLLPVASEAWGQSQSITLFERDSEYNHVVVADRGKLRVMNFRRRGVNHQETVIDRARPLRAPMGFGVLRFFVCAADRCSLRP